MKTSPCILCIEAQELCLSCNNTVFNNTNGAAQGLHIFPMQK